MGRVLKPLGTLIGYDLLSTAPARALHLADGSTHCLMRLDELRALTVQLPVGQAILLPGPGGLAVRFIRGGSRDPRGARRHQSR
jgi:hypothetical protein